MPFPTLKPLALLIGAFASASLLQAQSVTPMDNANVTLDTIQQTLMDDAIIVESFKFKGHDAQIGQFLGYEYLFGAGFDHGVILSTGEVASVVANTNQSDKSTTIFSDTEQRDDDLGDHIFDPAKITLEFVPNFSQLSLEFIFGSEEYNEYVGSRFNDRLEILVNGENCAKTPDGQSFSINTVNDRANFPPLKGEAGESSNPELYINNDPGETTTKEGGAETSRATLATEMDGFTKLLECTANVIAGETNRLVIGILDKGDAKLDSWVFFNANSLTVNPLDPNLDSDGDGIADVIERPSGRLLDSDNDGIPNYLDLDSDNDGIPDSIEYQGNLNDDPDGDGLVDHEPTNQTPVDTDGDGVVDYIDIDSDNDGLSDETESGLLTDIDQDGLLNYRDADSDGDAFDDYIENGDFDNDGINDRLQKETGLKTAVSGVGSIGLEWLLALPLLLLGRRLRKA
jgi:hypothetical protein